MLSVNELSLYARQCASDLAHTMSLILDPIPIVQMGTLRY